MNLREETIDKLKKHALWATKGLGQNFLVSEKALKTIVDAAEITPGEQILEIGPGLGTLTEALTQEGAKVKAIEMDTKFTQALHGFDVEFMDGLKYDPSKLGPYKLIANIPYYITSPLINHYLKDQENKPTHIVLLIQKEVAQKICSEKSSVLSLNIKVYGDPEIMGTVPASAFYPSPKVDSAILRIKVTDPRISCDPNAFYRIVKMAFSSPRKMLRNNLKTLLKDKEYPVDLNRRAETLSIEEFEALTLACNE